MIEVNNNKLFLQLAFDFGKCPEVSSIQTTTTNYQTKWQASLQSLGCFFFATLLHIRRFLMISLTTTSKKCPKSEEEEEEEDCFFKTMHCIWLVDRILPRQSRHRQIFATGISQSRSTLQQVNKSLNDPCLEIYSQIKTTFAAALSRVIHASVATTRRIVFRCLHSED